jgi:hypothetical protein
MDLKLISELITEPYGSSGFKESSKKKKHEVGTIARNAKGQSLMYARAPLEASLEQGDGYFINWQTFEILNVSKEGESPDVICFADIKENEYGWVYLNPFRSAAGGGGGGLDKVYHGNTLTGDGTEDVPLLVNPNLIQVFTDNLADKLSKVYTDSTLTGDGRDDNPLSVVGSQGGGQVYSDETLTGEGTKESLLSAKPTIVYIENETDKKLESKSDIYKKEIFKLIDARVGMNLSEKLLIFDTSAVDTQRGIIRTITFNCGSNITVIDASLYGLIKSGGSPYPAVDFYNDGVWHMDRYLMPKELQKGDLDINAIANLDGGVLYQATSVNEVIDCKRNYNSIQDMPSYRDLDTKSDIYYVADEYIKLSDLQEGFNLRNKILLFPPNWINPENIQEEYTSYMYLNNASAQGVKVAQIGIVQSSDFGIFAYGDIASAKSTVFATKSDGFNMKEWRFPDTDLYLGGFSGADKSIFVGDPIIQATNIVQTIDAAVDCEWLYKNQIKTLKAGAGLEITVNSGEMTINLDAKTRQKLDIFDKSKSANVGILKKIFKMR